MRRFEAQGSRPGWGWLSRVLLAAAFLAATAAAVAGADTDWKLVDEHWYVLELNGAKAGHSHEIVETDGERYRSTSDLNLKLGRGPAVTEFAVSTWFIETHAGEPVEFGYIQDTALMKVETRYVFEEHHVKSISRQAGREFVKELPLPEGSWLAPRALHRYWLEQRAGSAKQIEFRTIDPPNGLTPVSVRTELQGDAELRFNGRMVPVTVWKTSLSLAPGSETTAIEKYDADGRLMVSEADFGFGPMATTLATKAEALADPKGPGPEVVVKTFVTPDKPIKRAGHAKAARLRVRVREGRMPPLPSAGAQRVLPGDGDASAILDIDLGENLPADAGDAANPSYRESSAMIDAGDPLIQRMAERVARRAGDSALARAQAMRELVHDHVTEKDLDTAFASASETARTKTGDCSEHAVLLCAILRADGIPARVATGLVYAQWFLDERDIFGWHMWTQALIDGAWVDLDATLDRRYHAAHVLTATSSL
ncbi:MAG: transglutaminase-like domain-containing protein, partial [Planctomycetota bacterium]